MPNYRLVVYKKDGTIIAADIRNTPANATCLELWGVGHADGNLTDIITFFTSIPHGICSLDLTHSGIFYYLLIAALPSLPAHIRELTINTSDVFAIYMNGNIVRPKKFFKSLPPIIEKTHVIRLNLSIHGYDKNNEKIIQAIATAPTCSSYLKLVDVLQYGVNNTSYIANYFRAIPKHIHSLDLSQSSIHQRELMPALSHLPSHIRELTINYRHIYLTYGLSAKEIGLALPHVIKLNVVPTVTTVNWWTQKISMISGFTWENPF